MTEKPLHVQVAEALELWMHCSYEPPKNLMNLADKGRWVGYNPKTMLVGERGTVPHYDTDWSATGPLIEKYGISLKCSEPPLWGAFASPGFPILGGKPTDSRIYRVDTTPLGAVCHL